MWEPHPALRRFSDHWNEGGCALNKKGDAKVMGARAAETKYRLYIAVVQINKIAQRIQIKRNRHSLAELHGLRVH